MQLRSQKSQDERIAEWITDSTIFMENLAPLHPIDEDGFNLDKSLSECIEKLKDEQRNCIQQFYFENRCYNEIAINLHLDEKKVKSHLQNAKRNLKLCLEDKNDRQE
jgi:RNA polymerase sigma-70 factor (ECF subfamily)